MHLIKVRTADLKAELIKNKTTHTELYTKAFAKFSDYAIEALQAALLEAKTGRGIKLHFDLPVPHDHTAEYDRAIKMVEMSVDENLELTEQEFAMLVMDDWGWKQQFTASNSRYGVNA